MNADEYKRLAGSFSALTNADLMLRNFKTRAGKAAGQADKQYKEHKKDQPSWKVLGQSLSDVDKLVSPTIKTIQKVFEVGRDKKERETLSLVDAKKQARVLMTKLQPMDDAATAVLANIAKVIKEVDKGRDMNTALADMRAMQNYLPTYLEFFSKAKADINSLR